MAPSQPAVPAPLPPPPLELGHGDGHGHGGLRIVCLQGSVAAEGAATAPSPLASRALSHAVPLVIDTIIPLAQDGTPDVQGCLDNRAGHASRSQVYRVCEYAAVAHDASTIRPIDEARDQRWVTREALEWQADQDDDLNEVEVLHHLHQQAKTSPLCAETFSQAERTNASTGLVPRCAVPAPSLPANGRSLVVWCWCLQYSQFVDILRSGSHPIWRPGKRRRTTLNLFHQEASSPEEGTSPANHLPEAKRFKGVRYRRDRRIWAAEMKPPKYKNKVSFGEFKSQAQAARVVDAAFHYYDKPQFINFPDTPQILLSRPTVAGLQGEEDKLRFVKEQVKWLASIASTLPSSPTLAPSEIPESSSRGCAADILSFVHPPRSHHFEPVELQRKINFDQGHDLQETKPANSIAYAVNTQ